MGQGKYGDCKKYGCQTNLKRISHTIEKLSRWKFRVWRWAPHWAYNVICAAIWWCQITNQGERQFYKPTGNKRERTWRIQVSKISSMLQINVRYGFHEGKEMSSFVAKVDMSDNHALG